MHLSDISKHLAEYLDVIVVDEANVYYTSQSGYRLLYVIENGQTLHQPPSQWVGGQHVQPDMQVITRPLFVMGKVRDQLVEELRAQIEDQESAARTRTASLEAANKKLENAETTKKNLEDQLARVRLDHDGARETSRQYADRLRKMEADLARVRTHIGAKAFEEAISMTKEG